MIHMWSQFLDCDPCSVGGQGVASGVSYSEAPAFSLQSMQPHLCILSAASDLNR